MSIKYKILHYGVWGVLIGLGMSFSFETLRALSVPLITPIIDNIIDTNSEYLEFQGWLLVLLHAVLSGIVGSFIAAILILKLLKETNIKYCLIPSFVFLVWSYKGIVYYYIHDEAFTVLTYSQYILSTLLAVIMFFGMFWLVRKFTASNQALNSADA